MREVALTLSQAKAREERELETPKQARMMTMHADITSSSGGDEEEKTNPLLYYLRKRMKEDGFHSNSLRD